MNSSHTPDPSSGVDRKPSRRLHRALVEVDRDGQLDELAELAGGADIGLTILGTEDGEHLDFVDVVDVEGREDGLYVFAERADADRFADTVDHECDPEETVGAHRAFLVETPVNLGAAAERLIAAERGDALEESFGPALAEDVREGLPLDMVLCRVQEAGEDDSEAADLLRRWIDLDSRTKVVAGRRTFEIDALMSVEARSIEEAYAIANASGAPIEETDRDGVHVALLEGGREVGEATSRLDRRSPGPGGARGGCAPMIRLLVRVHRRRGDERSPYMLAEEIIVQHPIIFREKGRQSTVGGIPIRRMESTGRRDTKVFDVIVVEGSTARGFGAARSRDRAQAQATAAGVKKVCRRLRPRGAERIDTIDTEIAALEGEIAAARDRGEEAVRDAWAKANVVRLAEFEERTSELESRSSGSGGGAA